MTALATLDELKERVEWELSEDEERIAAAALEDISDLVRAGRRDWQPGACPAVVRKIALGAVVRYLRNPDGVTTSRAGDETVMWDGIGDKAGGVYLTTAEERILTKLVRPNGLTPVDLVAWAPTSREVAQRNGLPVGYVPTAGGGIFRYYRGDGPW
ncbi:hypothetical protein EDD28_0068 [Salana multivorans]|uniref:Gp19/Gp15/Gp42-like protein n=1 Tax=Salana multivorans TaxID=120377 RepID=A0A3N2D6Y2_9MICO|nr:hypothetical protein [Salana multivorans]ROR95512.1 hypothetical protein EDD28_0068 [Salana multivorans]